MESYVEVVSRDRRDSPSQQHGSEYPCTDAGLHVCSRWELNTERSFRQITGAMVDHLHQDDDHVISTCPVLVLTRP